MKLIPEYKNEALETLCHSVQLENGNRHTVGIDEQNLAWLFMDPAYQESDCCEKLFAWALSLLGNQAWLVLQSSEQACNDLIAAHNITIIESYRSEDADRQAIGLMLAHKA